MFGSASMAGGGGVVVTGSPPPKNCIATADVRSWGDSPADAPTKGRATKVAVVTRTAARARAQRRVRTPDWAIAAELLRVELQRGDLNQAVSNSIVCPSVVSFWQTVTSPKVS